VIAELAESPARLAAPGRGIPSVSALLAALPVTHALAIDGTRRCRRSSTNGATGVLARPPGHRPLVDDGGRLCRRHPMTP